jgi:hypothetical protein
MSDIYQLIRSYDCDVKPDIDQSCPALGLGDILFRLLHIQEGLCEPVFYINIHVYKTTEFYPNPYDQLKFRIELLKDILSNHKTLSMKNVEFVDKSTMYVHQDFRYDELKTLRLTLLKSFWDNIPKKIDTSEEYIVFHTKLRLLSFCNYKEIKEKISNLCAGFKSKYKLVILGEQTFPQTLEVNIHGITTIYDQLLKLKDNNNVCDLSEKDIYSNIKYESYKKDLEIIKNAKYNVCIGVGGHFCSSLIFGNTLGCPIIDSMKFFNIDGNKMMCSIEELFDFLITI